MHSLNQVTACGWQSAGSYETSMTASERTGVAVAASLIEKETCYEVAADAYLIQGVCLYHPFALAPDPKRAGQAGVMQEERQLAAAGRLSHLVLILVRDEASLL